MLEIYNKDRPREQKLSDPWKMLPDKNTAALIRDKKIRTREYYATHVMFCTKVAQLFLEKKIGVTGQMIRDTGYDGIVYDFNFESPAKLFSEETYVVFYSPKAHKLMTTGCVWP